MVDLELILTYLRTLAPEETALEDDPVGLLVGRTSPQSVGTVGFCLDATGTAIVRAIDQKCDCVVAHHPLIYRPLKRLGVANDPISMTTALLARHNVALYAMHTNWDRAPKGINDTLAKCVGLVDFAPFGDSSEESLPRIGNLASPMFLTDFLISVSSALDCTGTSSLRVNAPIVSRTISKVAVCGGAGASLASEAIKRGADAYVTSDVRHHEFVDATERGLALIDAGHSATETPGMKALQTLVSKAFPSIDTIWLGS